MGVVGVETRPTTDVVDDDGDGDGDDRRSLAVTGTAFRLARAEPEDGNP